MSVISSDLRSRATAWLDRNETVIITAASLIAFGYWAAGWQGAVAEMALVGGIISLSYLGTKLKRYRSGEPDYIVDGKDTRRTTYVRIQEPRILLVGLQIGGWLRGLGWKDVTAERYDTHPKGALEQAVKDYDGYRISHYVEQHPDAPIEDPLADIHENAWAPVDPERDLPDE